MKAIHINGGISGTTAILVDAAALFVKRTLKKINFKINTGARDTHEVCWWGYFVKEAKSSNVGNPENIHQDKLRKYENDDLFVSVISIFELFKLELWLKEGGDDEPVVAPISGMSSKATYYLSALQQMGIG